MPQKAIENSQYMILLKALWLEPRATSTRLRELTGLHRGHLSALLSKARHPPLNLLPSSEIKCRIRQWTREVIREHLEQNGYAFLIPILEEYAREKEAGGK